MRRGRLLFALLLAALPAARLAHIDILWPEEGLPLAAAGEMLRGRALYREIWFDKPPLLAAAPLLWGARDGWPARAAGAGYVLLCCWLGYRAASRRWGRGEGLWAAGLLAFFLTFYLPAAVVPLASDLLLVAPHLAAVWLAWSGRPFAAGAAAGVGFLFNTKALFVLAACAVWSGRGVPWVAAGFGVPVALAAAWLGLSGALGSYYDQVWRWGRLYAGDTFLEHPLREGLLRTANWLGFHAALVLPAAWVWHREKDRGRWLAWLALSLIAVIAGWRFFPRYYFQLLPVLALPAARGIALLGRRRWLVLALLLVPLLRFGPRYVLLARDLVADRPSQWSDTALDRDSREAAALVGKAAQPGDDVLVWGFRPELYVYTGLPAASRFLDAQPLTGVPADRHLRMSRPAAPARARANRQELPRLRPDFIIDGLGPLNPALAITRYPDLADWMSGYRPVARTRTCVIYRLSAGPTSGAFPEKRGDALLRVGRQRVHAHDLLGVGVGFGLVQVDLRIVGLLAESHGERAGVGNPQREPARGVLQFRSGHCLIDETPLGCGGRVHGFAGEQHLECALAADGAAQRHHGSGTEEPDAHAGRGERSLVGGDGQVAGRHQLASRRGSHALHLGNDGLGDGLELHHQLGADVEQQPVLVDVAPYHFREVVPGAEDLARRRQDDGADLALGADVGEAGDQLAHQLQREGVAPLGAVQGDHRGAALEIQAEVIELHSP
jgi:hypothetical protein